MDHVRVRDKEQHQQTATPPVHTPGLLAVVKAYERGTIVTPVVTCAPGSVKAHQSLICPLVNIAIT